MRPRAAVMRHPVSVRLIAATVMAASLAACGRGCAGADEMAFCDAIERKDAAAAQQLLDSGRVNLQASNLSGKCWPAQVAFDAAKANSPYQAKQSEALTALVVGLTKREGVATTCWSGGESSSSSGSARRRAESSSGMRCPIDSAVENSNAVVLRALIDAGVHLHDFKAQGAVMTAALQGSLEMVTMLVEAGVNPSWALPSAVANRHPAIVEYLEKKGAREDVDELLVAARRGDLPSIDAAIAKRADLEVRDAWERTPLIRAALYGHPDAITRLAKAGAQVNAVAEGQTALHVAANENQVEVIRALVAAGANVNIQTDPTANTPLYTAIQNHAARAVAALIDAGADANAGPDNDTTPLGLAIVRGHLAMTRELLRGGARINEIRGLSQRPAIHGSLGICARPLDGDDQNDNYRVALLRTVVEAGADRNAKNASGETAIEVAAKELAGAEGDFYRACHQAKLDYLRSLR
jgi:ankyrin repeat protein